jgi:hypothetical protein
MLTDVLQSGHNAAARSTSIFCDRSLIEVTEDALERQSPR